MTKANRLLFCQVPIALTLLAASSLHANILTSNIGNATDGIYLITGPTASVNWARGQQFLTDGNSYMLTSVDLLTDAGGVDSGFFEVTIRADSAGKPGATLITLSGDDSPDGGIETYTGNLNLAPNTAYWVVATVSSGDSQYRWSRTKDTSEVNNGASMLNTSFLSNDGGATWPAGPNGIWHNRDPLQMAVNVGVPEPGPGLLGAMVFTGWFLLRRRG